MYKWVSFAPWSISKIWNFFTSRKLPHLPSVRVVHGRGTGALKAGIHKYLKRQKNVKDFRLGEFGEGDSGVTIVTFK